MKHLLRLALVLGWALNGYSHDTNAPRTLLQAFEDRTQTVIVKGSAEIGTVEVPPCAGVAVVARESTDKQTKEKALGVLLIVRGMEKTQDTTFIDADELDALIAAMGTMSTPQWGSSSMQQIESSFTSRDGLRLACSAPAAKGSEAVLKSQHCLSATVPMNAAQFNSLRVLLGHAKGKLDAIKAGDGK